MYCSCVLPHDKATLLACTHTDSKDLKDRLAAGSRNFNKSRTTVQSNSAEKLACEQARKSRVTRPPICMQSYARKQGCLHPLYCATGCTDNRLRAVKPDNSGTVCCILMPHRARCTTVVKKSLYRPSAGCQHHNKCMHVSSIHSAANGSLPLTTWTG
jgi:hypothetical protein